MGHRIAIDVKDMSASGSTLQMTTETRDADGHLDASHMTTLVSRLGNRRGTMRSAIMDSSELYHVKQQFFLGVILSRRLLIPSPDCIL